MATERGVVVRTMYGVTVTLTKREVTLLRWLAETNDWRPWSAKPPGIGDSTLFYCEAGLELIERPTSKDLHFRLTDLGREALAEHEREAQR